MLTFIGLFIVGLLLVMIILATAKAYDEHSEDYRKRGGTFGGHQPSVRRQYVIEQAITVLAGAVLIAVVVGAALGIASLV